MFSKLIRFTPTPDVNGDRFLPAGDYAQVDDGTLTPPYLHLPPSTPIPQGATVIKDGSVLWTWGDIASDPNAAHLIPHQFLGDDSVLPGATPQNFPLMGQ